MNQRSIFTTGAALAAGLIFAVAAPLAAHAHVVVSPAQAAAGSFTILTFTVPTESATAATTKLVVSLPRDTPFANVSYVPVPGWTTQLAKEVLAKPIKSDDGEVTEAVTTVTWTATPGNGIQYDQIQRFPLSVGPIPSIGSMLLPIEQTYSDGTVVNWSDAGANTQHPAPLLYINDAPVSDHHAGSADVAVTPVDATTAHGATATATATDDVLARVLAIGGLIVGAIGVVIGVAGRRTTKG